MSSNAWTKIPGDAKPKLTGGRVNYYLVKVEHPQREGQDPYQAECEDIIQALGMDFNEGCLFKALWRSANARKGNGKPDHKATYDAEKMVHYATRILRELQWTDAAKVAPADSLDPGWISWEPGEHVPPNDTTLHYQLRNGTRVMDLPVRRMAWRWDGKNPSCDIVAYKFA